MKKVFWDCKSPYITRKVDDLICSIFCLLLIRRIKLLLSLPEWVQKFKEPRTDIKRVGGHFYKYPMEYRYNKQKKRTDNINLSISVILLQIFGPIANRRA